MDCIAAKIAQEIGVLFDDDHIDSGAGEQKPEHHPGGAAANDAAPAAQRSRKLISRRRGGDHGLFQFGLDVRERALHRYCASILR